MPDRSSQLSDAEPAPSTLSEEELAEAESDPTSWTRTSRAPERASRQYPQRDSNPRSPP